MLNWKLFCFVSSCYEIAERAGIALGSRLDVENMVFGSVKILIIFEFPSI